MKKRKNIAGIAVMSVFAIFILTGCGGGDGGGGLFLPAEKTYTVGGTVSGLSGTLALRNNNTDDLTITENGGFTFATALESGSAYAVTVRTQPSGQTCTVESGAGTVAGADITNISVTCHNSGSLDTSFGTGGKVITGIGSGTNENVYDMLVQPDGKIIAAGSSYNGAKYEFALVRYNTDGTLDTTFDGDGIVTTSTGSWDDLAEAIAIQPDGKIVAAGYSYSGVNFDFALVRYNSDGSLDTTFGTEGIVTTAIGSGDDHAYAIAVQSDGKIVVAGRASNDFGLARYKPDGSLDSTFDADGILTDAVGGSGGIAEAVAIQSDGKIVVAGSTFTGDAVLVRYDTGGSHDTDFDSDGIVTTDIESSSNGASALAIQSDGKIVVAGDFYNGTNSEFSLVRYNSDGTLDTTFDGDGIVTAATGNDDRYAEAMAVQTDGKIVVAGYADAGATGYIVLVRYNANGSLDTSFNTDGIVSTAIGTYYDGAEAVAIQPDGKIVVAGLTGNENDDDMVTVRYWQ